jgi:syntaxin 16
VEKGVEQIKAAEKTQKQGRMFLCIIALIVLIVIMLIIVIIKNSI